MLERIPPKGDARVVKDARHLHRLLRPGVALRAFLNRAFPGPRLHIRAVVDGEHVVLRRYSRRKGWVYQVEHVSYFEHLVRAGELSVVAYRRERPEP